MALSARGGPTARRRPAPPTPIATSSPLSPVAAPATASASPRLALYVGVGAAALLTSLVAARPALAAFGAPLLLLAVAGVCLSRRPELRSGHAVVVPGQAMEGDELTVGIDLEARPAPARTEVLLATRGPVDARASRSGRIGWIATGAATMACRTTVGTSAWGRVAVPELTVRAEGPLGLVRWTWHVPLSASARVLPRPERLRHLLDPPPRAAAGTHASTARGAGLDFAELRSLTAGDHLADVNWRAKPRRGHPARGDLLVNVRHPERTGDVVLLLDASADESEDDVPWLPRLARAAWAIASAHLATHDRVGLVSIGGYTSWVTLGGGERAAYALLDKLLSVQPAVGGVSRPLRWLPARLLPADAAVVAVTPLHCARAIDALVDLRRRGRRVAALVVDTTDLLPTEPRLDVAARFWRLELDRRVELLTRASVVTARWPADGTLATAMTLLARLARPTRSTAIGAP